MGRTSACIPPPAATPDAPDATMRDRTACPSFSVLPKLRALTRAVTLAACLVMPVQAFAAEITGIEITPGFGLITVTGQIVAGDAQRFSAIARQYPGATVRLTSPGGELEPALAIGTQISARRFATSVAPSSLCASACALVWLAGTPRIMSADALIVFHASYRLETDGRRVLSKRGIGRVRQYLARLRLPAAAVSFAAQDETGATPEESLARLTPDKARSLGLAVDIHRAPMAGAPFPQRPAMR
jgi:hypothetical protein